MQVLNEKLDEFLTLAAVLPFRTNNYVVEELIDWSNVPEDPIFQLTFPQPGMLPQEWLEEVHAVRMGGGTAAEVRRAADKVRAKMNPHPAKQREMNVPNHKNLYDGETEFERGMQVSRPPHPPTAHPPLLSLSRALSLSLSIYLSIYLSA